MLNIKKIFWLWFVATLIITGWLVFAFPSTDITTWSLSNGIDQWLTVALPCNPTSVNNGDVNATTCAITCHSNYTLNGATCTANQWGGWGGGWTPHDSCPNNIDLSPSLYDGLCTGSITTGSTWGGGNWGWGTAGGSIVWSTYSTERNNAYLYAYSIGITTMWTIQLANLDGNLIRSHMAKMMVNYAIKVLDRTPDTWALCEFDDIANQSTEMKFYINLACQLGIMGQGITSFDPEGIVTRAQFGTVLSRTLYGTEYNNEWAEYYLNHLQALADHGIITNTDPTLVELRGYVMLMLMRAAN